MPTVFRISSSPTITIMFVMVHACLTYSDNSVLFGPDEPQYQIVDNAYEEVLGVNYNFDTDQNTIAPMYVHFRMSDESFSVISLSWDWNNFAFIDVERFDMKNPGYPVSNTQKFYTINTNQFDYTTGLPLDVVSGWKSFWIVSWITQNDFAGQSINDFAL